LFVALRRICFGENPITVRPFIEVIIFVALLHFGPTFSRESSSCLSPLLSLGWISPYAHGGGSVYLLLLFVNE